MTLLDRLFEALTGGGSSGGSSGGSGGSSGGGSTETGGGGNGGSETGGEGSSLTDEELVELLQADFSPITERLDTLAASLDDLEVGVVSLFVAVSLLMGIIVGVELSKVIRKVWDR